MHLSGVEGKCAQAESNCQLRDLHIVDRKPLFKHQSRRDNLPPEAGTALKDYMYGERWPKRGLRGSGWVELEADESYSLLAATVAVQ